MCTDGFASRHVRFLGCSVLGLWLAACGGGGGDPVDPCTPNPCTQVPPDACAGNSVTTYRPACLDNAGEPDCTYEVADSRDCGVQRCDPDSVTCVACLVDADCPVQGLLCREHTCVQPCAPDAREENDTAAQATALRGNEDWPGLSACEGDQDWFRIRLTATAELTARVAYEPSAGELLLVLIAPDGTSEVGSGTRVADGLELVQTIGAEGEYFVRVSPAPGVWSSYRLVITVTGGSDPCMPDPCSQVPPTECLVEQLVSYRGDCTASGGAPVCAYSVDQTIDCAAQGLHCDPVGLACVACLTDGQCAAGERCIAGACLDDPCLPDPCTQIPALACVGEVLTSYRAECEVVDQAPSCSYPADQTTDCATQGQRCDPLAPACVDCLTDAECEWPFEVCQAGLCAAGCQDDLREPDDTSASASVITTDTSLASLVLCGGDQDWFGLDMQEGTVLTATVSHDALQGDLDLALLAPDGVTVLEISTGPDVPAGVHHTVQAGQGGRHFLRVVGAGSSQAVYSLLTTSSLDACIPSPCTLIPAAECAGQSLTTYRGECSLVNDLPTCDYPVDQVVDCAAQGRLCDAASAACVECLSDAHCVWPFEVCLAGLCAAGCQDDVGEPDDAAAEAGAIQPDDLLSDRVLCSGDEDWYQVALEQGDRFEVLLGFTHADGNLDLDLLGPDGVSLVASSHGGLDDELVDYTLPAGGSGTYFLRVFGVAGAHNLYSLLTARTDDPCLPSPCDAIPPPVCQGETLVTYLPQCLPDGLGGASCSYPASQTDCLLQGLRCNPAAPACVDCLGTADCAWPFEVCQGTACVSGCQDDAREENDAAATASAVTPGQLYPDLVACGNDDDWFSVSLAPQQTLRGRIDFTHAAGDLSLQVVGPDGSTVLATSATASDFEQAAATNTTAGAATHYVRVYGVAGAHNVYQLGATVLPDPCDPSPCTAVPPPACVGNILTTYQGVCANDLGAASCSYPPATQQDCTTSGGLCQASTCVGRFANAGDLVITEIMYDPNLVLDRYGEYVEVMSIAADTVNLRGLTFSDLAANNFSIGVDVFVAPGAYAVLGVSANLNQNGGAPVDWAWGGNQGILNNDTAGETVFLRRGATVVDQASYCDVGAGCFPSSPGASLQLDLDHADPASNDDPAFWCRTPAGTTYGDGDRGTPGADNTDCGVLLKLPI